MSNDENLMVNKCEESFDCRGGKFSGNEHEFLCKQEDIDPKNLQLCSNESYEGNVSANISYYENTKNGRTYAFYTFDDGSWGYHSD